MRHYGKTPLTIFGCLSRQLILLFYDNKTTFNITHNLVQHNCTNRVAMNKFFIKEKLDLKIVELSKIKSKGQLINIRTKVISYKVYSSFLSKLDIYNIYTLI